MKKCLRFFFPAGLVFTAIAFAVDQDYPLPIHPPRTTTTTGSTETVQEVKTITDSGTRKTSTDSLIGKVESYQPGNWIEISTPGKIEGIRRIDLTGKKLTAHVASDVKVGEWANVSVKSDNDGQKTILVEPRRQASRARSK